MEAVSAASTCVKRRAFACASATRSLPTYTSGPWCRDEKGDFVFARNKIPRDVFVTRERTSIWVFLTRSVYIRAPRTILIGRDEGASRYDWRTPRSSLPIRRREGERRRKELDRAKNRESRSEPTFVTPRKAAFTRACVTCESARDRCDRLHNAIYASVKERRILVKGKESRLSVTGKEKG